jgi:hypothetical protein
MKKRNQRKSSQRSKSFESLKIFWRFCSRNQILASCGIICLVIVTGLLAVYRYGFTMTTEKDLHEKRTIEIGVNAKAPSEVAIIASSSAPVQEVFDKVAEINRLNRKLLGQPALPTEMLRPTSIKMDGTNGFPVEMRVQEMNNSLNQELERLQMLACDTGKPS